jgi:hypothetical protein
MSDTEYSGDHSAVIEQLLDSLPDDTLLVGPSPATLEALVSAAESIDDSPPTLDVLATDDVLKAVRDDFILAAALADLVEAGTLSLRSLPDSFNNTLFVAEGTLYLLDAVDDPDDLLGLLDADHYPAVAIPADDPDFIADAVSTYRQAYDAAEPFDLRTPGRSTIRQTLPDAVSPAMQADLEAVLSSVDTLDGSDGLDDVTLTLLVAADNEEQLYQISKWAEDIGIASKATFSRTKTDLEEQGLIDTEKVPTDLGRPRLRLLVADDDLASASPEEFADLARNRLS